MLVIQHLKEYIPYEVSVLKLSNHAGDTLLHAGSHGVILAEGGALCPIQTVPSVSLLSTFNPNSNPCRQKGIS
jgi:hypothetical protein